MVRYEKRGDSTSRETAGGSNLLDSAELSVGIRILLVGSPQTTRSYSPSLRPRRFRQCILLWPKGRRRLRLWTMKRVLLQALAVAGLLAGLAACSNASPVILESPTPSGTSGPATPTPDPSTSPVPAE